MNNNGKRNVIEIANEDNPTAQASRHNILLQGSRRTNSCENKNSIAGSSINFDEEFTDVDAVVEIPMREIVPPSSSPMNASDARKSRGRAASLDSSRHALGLGVVMRETGRRKDSSNTNVLPPMPSSPLPGSTTARSNLYAPSPQRVAGTGSGMHSSNGRLQKKTSRGGAGRSISSVQQRAGDFEDTYSARGDRREVGGNDSVVGVNEGECGLGILKPEETTLCRVSAKRRTK